jgi:hypothetical protein
MSKPNSRTRTYSLLTLFLAFPLLLSLTQCHAAAPPVGVEHCGGVVCTSNYECGANPPVCASTTGATCLLTSPRECAWKLNISSSCPCMEHDVRLCQYNGGPGVQICGKTSSTSTQWGGCQACPNCSL